VIELKQSRACVIGPWQ